MIYTLFGGKSGLLKAVYLSKSEELSDKLAEITTSDPIDRLFELGTIYRQFMLDHKALFDAVFSLRTVRNFKGSGALIDRTPAFDYFQKAIEDLIDEGYLAEQTDPKTLTDRLWAGVIGVLLLETLGFYSDSESAREAFFDVAISIVFGKLKDDDLQDAFAQGLDIV
jgi:AcrR family transcriptional regulator